MRPAKGGAPRTPRRRGRRLPMRSANGRKRPESITGSLKAPAISFPGRCPPRVYNLLYLSKVPIFCAAPDCPVDVFHAIDHRLFSEGLSEASFNCHTYYAGPDKQSLNLSLCSALYSQSKGTVVAPKFRSGRVDKLILPEHHSATLVRPFCTLTLYLNPSMVWPRASSRYDQFRRSALRWYPALRSLSPLAD